MAELLDGIQDAARNKTYLVATHMLKRLLERGIDIRDVAAGLASASAEVIEDYPEHYISPCCLILCRGTSGKWYHVVCSYPPTVTMVTVYEPDPAQWTADLRRRVELE